MADLKTLIKQNGLKKTSQEELSSLSDKVGLSANPISPLSAQTIGANKDQAKMAGSSANKAVSLQDSALSLRDTLRREQSQEATEEEKKKKETTEVLSAFTGKLDDRVQAIAQQKLGGQVGTPTLQPKVNSQKVAALFPSVAPERQGQLTASIEKLFASPSDLTAAREVAAALGMDASNLSADQLISKVNGALESEKEQLAGMADQIEDSVSVADVFATPEAMEAFGDPSLLANALGLPLEQFMNSNLPAIKAKMEEIGLESFSDISDLQRRLNDPYTAPGERRAIQRELQRLGATGVRATERDMAKLDEEISSANTVEIGGNSYTTEELLKDDTINALIADYLEDPEAKEQLAGSPLADFIERNRVALSAASANLAGNARALADVAQKNRDLAKTKSGAPISDNVMKALFPSWGSLEAIDPNNPAYQNLISMSPSAQDIVSSALSGVKDPSLVQGVLNADRDTLENLANTGGLTSWLSFRQLRDEAENMSPENAVRSLLGKDPAQFSQTLKDFRNAEKAGLIQNYSFPFADVLDANKDGVLDDPKTLKAALLTMADGLADNVPREMKDAMTPAGQVTGLGNFLPNTKSVYARLKDYIGDGSFGMSDAVDIAQKGSDTDLRDVYDSGVGTKLAREQISQELTNRSFKQIGKMLAEQFPFPENPFDLAGTANTIMRQREKLNQLAKSSDMFEAAAARKQLTTLSTLYDDRGMTKAVMPAVKSSVGGGTSGPSTQVERLKTPTARN